MSHKTCFFIGHRDTPDSIIEQLRYEIEKHITEYGVKEFIVGHHGGFDFIVQKELARAKEKHPHIILTMLLPEHPSICPLVPPDGFDGTYYPEGMEFVPYKFSIVRANWYVAFHADYLIANAWKVGSNSKKLVEYAQKREKRGKIKVTVLKYL